MQSFVTLEPHILSHDAQQPQIQLLLRKNREILPKRFLCDFDLNSCGRNPLQSLLETIPKTLLQRTLAQGEQPPPLPRRKKPYWNPEEVAKLEEALKVCKNKDLKAISEYIGTRTVSQVRSKLQKYYQKKERLLKQQAAQGGSRGPGSESGLQDAQPREDGQADDESGDEELYEEDEDESQEQSYQRSQPVMLKKREPLKLVSAGPANLDILQCSGPDPESRRGADGPEGHTTNSKTGGQLSDMDSVDDEMDGSSGGNDSRDSDPLVHYNRTEQAKRIGA